MLEALYRGGDLGLVRPRLRLLRSANQVGTGLGSLQRERGA